MSIWICKKGRRLRTATAFLGLSLAAACTDGAGGFGFLQPAPEKVVVAGKSVVIAGPPGYCVDTTATRDSTTGAFVLLGSCASIANTAVARAPTTPGMLTASVSGTSGSAISASLGQLEAFFTSEAGRAALARDGRASSVRILQTRRKGQAFYIHVRDKSENAIQGLSQDYWRGLFDVQGRIVTVSVVGFDHKPMSDATGLATLNAFAARIRTENSRLSDGTAPTEPAAL